MINELNILMSNFSLIKRAGLKSGHPEAMALVELVNAGLATPTEKAYFGCLRKLRMALEPRTFDSMERDRM